MINQTIIFSGFCLLLFIYLSLIVFFVIGFYLLKNFNPVINKSLNVFASIIIPARNESNNIRQCIESICNQNHSSESFEIIIVDDASIDDTKFQVESLIREYHNFNFKLISLPFNEHQGKKNAIEQGILASIGELIITLDADCLVGKQWLSHIVSYYREKQPKMIVLPVNIEANHSFFSNIQSLEFMGLIASSAGSLGCNLPLMCNGANLAYPREAFELSGSYSSNQKIASGDDMFLMFGIQKKFGKASVHFLKNLEVIARTQASPTLKSLINQRLRWTSKSKAYTNPWVIFVALIVFISNLVIILSWVFPFINLITLNEAIFLLSFKASFDFILLFTFARYYKQKKTLWFYLPGVFLIPVYTFLIAIFGNIIPSKWKGRRVSAL